MIDILIPTLGRADKLAPLLDNINEVASVVTRVWFIAEYDDEPTRKVLNGLDAFAVFGEFGSCAKAMNAGFEASSDTFAFTANDDLRFHKGWDTAAIDQIGNYGACGTNDGNDRMTCFALVKRSFIETMSGVFDKPGTLYHEYQSQYVDTEFADYAKARGMWTEAPDSLTEHMHHEFGKADGNHPNYQKARETCADDYATYLARRPLWEAAAKEQPCATA